MFNLITAEEKSMMMEYIREYAFRGKAIDQKPLADFNHIFRFWAENKSKYLSSLFGDKLILERDIVTEQPFTEIEREIQKACDKKNCYPAVYNFIKNLVQRNRKIYADNLSDTEIYWAIMDLCNNTYLATNKYEGNTVKFVSRVTGKEIKIQNGCKTIRMLGKIAKDMGIDGFDEFAAAMSVITTKKDIKGKLCLSIHPFDYMTMSDNDNNWSSCMSWIECGSYRQGTVEMMNSSMVVVAYFKSEEDSFIPLKNYPSFKWNNKKWRELFIVTPDIITNIKAYPYKNTYFTTEALRWLRELADNVKLGNYEDEMEEWHYEEGPDNILVTFSTEAMYNDFEADERQLSYFSKDVRSINIHYSGEHECMCTGDEKGATFSDWTEDLVSDNGYHYDLCNHCGQKHLRHNCGEFKGKFYCLDCFDRLPVDVISGETMTPEETMEVVIAYPDDAPLDDRLLEVSCWRLEPVEEKHRGKTYIDARLRRNYVYKDIASEDFEAYYGVELHRKEGKNEKIYAVVYLNELTEEFCRIVKFYDNKEAFLKMMKERYEKIF